MSSSVLDQATQALALVRSSDGTIQTEQFLAVCRLVLGVVDQLGTAFALVKSDISGNIQRLADKHATDPTRYVQVVTIVQDEIVAGTQGGGSSCTKGLLWLKRAMEFMLVIVRSTAQQPEKPLATVVSETYTSTLMQFHGFLVSSAFTLAFKFVPTREYFIENISKGSTGEAPAQMQQFVAAFEPILKDVHDFLVQNNLDDPSKV